MAAYTFYEPETAARTSQGRPNEAVYEAQEDDFEYDEYGQVVYEEDYEEDEEDEPEPRAALVSDVGPEVYWDDSSLFSCWEAAMLEYKYQHPARFGPLTEAPRTVTQKHEGAPLWYGPLPISGKARSATPASIPSTNPKRKSKKTKGAAAKRRKMSEALNLEAANPNNDLQSNGILTTPSSPKWTPKSPTFQRQPSPPLPELLHLPIPSTSYSSIVRDDPPHRPTNGRPVVAGPRLPSPQGFQPPPIPPTTTLERRSYPLPPPIVPIQPGDAEALSESPEQLLQDSLWAWYHAGYATAMYHASMAATSTTNGTDR